nr:immunoglobulin light chain junction region [Macaca mulatta]
CMIWYNNVYIF